MIGWQAIVIEALTKYGKFLAADNLNLKIGRGSFVGFQGLNGADDQGPVVSCQLFQATPINGASVKGECPLRRWGDRRDTRILSPLHPPEDILNYLGLIAHELS